MMESNIHVDYVVCALVQSRAALAIYLEHGPGSLLRIIMSIGAIPVC